MLVARAARCLSSLVATVASPPIRPPPDNDAMAASTTSSMSPRSDSLPASPPGAWSSTRLGRVRAVCVAVVAWILTSLFRITHLAFVLLNVVRFPTALRYDLEGLSALWLLSAFPYTLHYTQTRPSYDEYAAGRDTPAASRAARRMLSTPPPSPPIEITPCLHIHDVGRHFRASRAPNLFPVRVSPSGPSGPPPPAVFLWVTLEVPRVDRHGTPVMTMQRRCVWRMASTLGCAVAELFLQPVFDGSSLHETTAFLARAVDAVQAHFAPVRPALILSGSSLPATMALLATLQIREVAAACRGLLLLDPFVGWPSDRRRQVRFVDASFDAGRCSFSSVHTATPRRCQADVTPPPVNLMAGPNDAFACFAQDVASKVVASMRAVATGPMRRWFPAARSNELNTPTMFVVDADAAWANDSCEYASACNQIPQSHEVEVVQWSDDPCASHDLPSFVGAMDAAEEWARSVLMFPTLSIGTLHAESPGLPAVHSNNSLADLFAGTDCAPLPQSTQDRFAAMEQLAAPLPQRGPGISHVRSVESLIAD